MQGAHRGAVGKAAERVKECICSDLHTLLFTPLGAGTCKYKSSLSSQHVTYSVIQSYLVYSGCYRS